MSSRKEKLEAARRKLKQFKHDKQVPEKSTSAHINSSESQRHSVVSSADGSEAGAQNLADIAKEDDELCRSYVIAQIPPPSDSSSPMANVSPFDIETMDKMKADLVEAAETISSLLEEKKQLSSELETTKNSLQQYAQSGHAVNQHIAAYQQAFQEYEKKYTLEVQYRQQLETQIADYHTSKEAFVSENSALKQKIERCEEIMSELQEKLQNKTNIVHNLEIKNEELTNSLELANISLKQHRVSVKSLEEIKEQEKKANYQKEQTNLQLQMARDNVAKADSERDSIKSEMAELRTAFDKQELALKSEIFQLKETIERQSSENNRHQEKNEAQNDQLLNIDKNYILRTEVASMRSNLQNLTLEKESLLEGITAEKEISRKHAGKIRELEDALDALREENEQMKSDIENKNSLVERTQNDRTTISRAMNQNAELKKLLEESEGKAAALQQSMDVLTSEIEEMKHKEEFHHSLNDEIIRLRNDLEDEMSLTAELRGQVLPKPETTEVLCQTESGDDEIVFVSPSPCEEASTQTDKQPEQPLTAESAVETMMAETIEAGQQTDENLSPVVINSQEQNQLSASEAEIDALRHEAKSSKERVIELEVKIEEIERKKRADNAWRQEEFSRLNHDVADRTAHIDVLKEEISELKQQLAQMDALKSEISELRSQKSETVLDSEVSSPGLSRKRCVSELSDSQQEVVPEVLKLEVTADDIEEEAQVPIMKSSPVLSSPESLSPPSSPPPFTSAAAQDNYRKLQVKCQAMSKECERLRFENSQLETTNAKLSAENDTIADYIFMYHAQRTAMRDRDKSKSEFIEKVLSEKEELKLKIYELQCVLTSFLHPKEHPKSGDSSSGNQTHDEERTSDASEAPSIDDELKTKLSQVLESVRHVSGGNFPPIELKYSNCPCCTGKLLVV